MIREKRKSQGRRAKGEGGGLVRLPDSLTMTVSAAAARLHLFFFSFFFPAAAQRRLRLDP